MQKNIFIFMGAPGSGKGTLASICKKTFNWKKLSTGDLCRRHIANATEIGIRIKQIIESGELVADEIIGNMIKDWLLEQENSGCDIVFDGYPRTLSQAETFCDFLKNELSGFQVWLIKLNVPEHVIVERVLSRLICSNKSCQAVYSSLPSSSYVAQKYMTCDLCETALENRIDDTKESILHRISVYNKHENNIIKFFMDKSGLCQCSHFIELDGNQTMKQILNDLKKNNIIIDDSK
jgi:adenylate kinase